MCRDTLLACCLATLVPLSAAGGGAPASPPEKLYKGYYLETAQRDYAGAAQAYREVATDQGADPQIRSEAQARLESVREDLACTDFARLMPPTTFAYFELRQPGDQLEELVEQLGLLAKADAPMSTDARVAISPTLIRQLLGIRGAAIAVTGFDPMKQKPAGVVVLHPGDMEIVRGLIETGLPIASRPVEPIGGFPTYDIEGELLVTLTSRLIIASPQRAQIDGVLRRVRGEDDTSLATNADLTTALQKRDDALLFFCLNAKPILPMLNGMLAAGAMQNREIAVARALLDVNSLQSLVGRAGVGSDGLFLDLTLRLNPGHHNLVYNLLRTPSASRELLNSVPSGVAGFLVGALNDAGPRLNSTPAPSGDAPAVVTALDFGRELFANIMSFAVFALPPAADVERNPPVPDLAAVVSVIDADRSEALWAQVLGIAAVAAGARNLDGTPVEINGVDARRYQLPKNAAVYLATDGNDVLLSTTREAMARSIQARRTGQSVLDDDVFAASLSRFGPDTTRGVFVHPGRVLGIARQFMSRQEFAEMEAFLPALSNTVASVVVDHSDNAFHLSCAVTGLPEVGGVVAQLLKQERLRHEAHARLNEAISDERWDDALSLVNDLLSQRPGRADLLRKKFYVLAVGKNDRSGAKLCADEIYQALNNNSKALNNFAWTLLTEDEYRGQYAQCALKMSKRSNELSDRRNWAYLDTLALAQFETGNPEKAVELERRAIKLSDGKDAVALQAALVRFEQALGERQSADSAR
ncbi:MAG: hypothetical protein ACE5HE_00380 [Phycisphaerae bacterium]